MAGALAVALSSVAQTALLSTGFLSLAADDAARVIRARQPLAPGVLLQPDVWLPFDRIVYSVAMSIGGGPVVAPRVATGIAGVGVAVAVTWLAWELTSSRAATVLTAGLVAIVPHRLIFSVSTMGDVFLDLLVVVAVAFVVRWLRDADRGALIAAAVSLGVATTTRYEAWFFAATLGIAVLWWWRRGRVRWTDVLWTGLALSLYPVAWLWANVTSTGPIDFLTITRQQAAMGSPSLVRTVANSAVVRLGVDVLWFPALLLAVLLAGRWLLRGGWRREYVLLAGVPLVLLTLTTVATGSVAFAAAWRLGGVWVLLGLPLAAHVLVRWAGRPGGLRLLAAALLTVSVAGAVARDVRLTSDSTMTTEEVELARTLAETGERTLVDVRPGDRFGFLDIYAASPTLDHLELSTGDDPYLLALFVRSVDEWAAVRPDLVDRYVSTRFDLDDRATVDRLGCSFGTVLVNRGAVEDALIAAGGVVEGRRAGWTVISLRC